LEELDISNAGLTGPIPPEIVNLTNLKKLRLTNNQLSGKIPPEIGYLTNLNSLELDHNLLEGGIPFEFGNLTKLRILKLNDNQLTGEISDDICNLNILWYSSGQINGGVSWYSIQSSFANNQFCPPYPSCNIVIGQQDVLNCWDCEEDDVVELWGECYSKVYTTILDLSNRGLTGSIPIEIGNLTNLERLYLNENQLTGEIPSEIGNLTNLTSINLSVNSLTGSIPNEIGSLTNLSYLNLSQNQLSGFIPNEICSLNLTWFGAHDNGLNPTSEVHNNQFCPPYPSCIDHYVLYQDTSNCD
tara:strand:+ start:311 stop:1210 length:900 start_codon:yes stop_codon:yes gene_type:complete